jgi:hypothetical protein
MNEKDKKRMESAVLCSMYAQNTIMASRVLLPFDVNIAIVFYQKDENYDSVNLSVYDSLEYEDLELLKKSFKEALQHVEDKIKNIS